MPAASRAAGTIHDRFSSSSPWLRLGRNSRIGVKPASCSTMRWIVMSSTLKLVRIRSALLEDDVRFAGWIVAPTRLADKCSDPPPVCELLPPGAVDDAERPAMADRENLGRVTGKPVVTGRPRNETRRVSQCEEAPHRPPPGIAHPDDDRGSQIADERAKVPLGTGIDPARQDRAVHGSLFNAEDRVGQKYRRLGVARRRMLYSQSCLEKQLVQIFIRRVMRLVAPAIAHEIADIAEVLANDEKLGVAVPEPLLPMADHRRIELELGAATDPARAALDADPAGLAGRHKCLKILHALAAALPEPGPSRRRDGASDPRGRAVRGGRRCSPNSRDKCRVARPPRE